MDICIGRNGKKSWHMVADGEFAVEVRESAGTAAKGVARRAPHDKEILQALIAILPKAAIKMTALARVSKEYCDRVVAYELHRWVQVTGLQIGSWTDGPDYGHGPPVPPPIIALYWRGAHVAHIRHLAGPTTVIGRHDTIADAAAAAAAVTAARVELLKLIPSVVS